MIMNSGKRLSVQAQMINDLSSVLMKAVAVILCALSVSWLTAAQSEKLSPEQSSLVETERAFARTSVVRGQAEAWVEFFTDDGVIFQPQPVNSKEVMRKRLPTPQPPPATLNWEPVYGDISKGGDLGYNLGPWNLSDNTPQHRPSRHGYFFSVWRRQPDAKWKVEVDFGIGVTTPNDDHKLGGVFHRAPSFTTKTLAAHGAAAERNGLMNLDRDFARLAATSTVLDAYEARSHETIMVLREDTRPISGKNALRTFLTGPDLKLNLNPIKAGFSRLGDLGYSFGSYELSVGSELKEKGYYCEIWKRDETGAWKVVVTNFRPE
jgi:ketosteroid isomerase-like protein